LGLLKERQRLIDRLEKLSGHEQEVVEGFIRGISAYKECTRNKPVKRRPLLAFQDKRTNRS
jgi:hypothetical protein